MNNEVNLYELMLQTLKQTVEPDSFEIYNDLDKGVKCLVGEKLIFEYVNKKYFVRFRSISQEISNDDFYHLEMQWHDSKSSAEKLKKDKLYEEDMPRLLFLRDAIFKK